MPGRMGSVMTGVLMDCAAVMNSSRRRGIPSVTFASPRPEWCTIPSGHAGHMSQAQHTHFHDAVLWAQLAQFTYELNLTDVHLNLVDESE